MLMPTPDPSLKEGEKYAKNGCGKTTRTHFSLLFLTLRTH